MARSESAKSASRLIPENQGYNSRITGFWGCSMYRHRAIALGAGLLLVAAFANAISKDAIRIKVLDSETHSVTLDDSGVPKNCDPLTYDAYCHNSKTAEVINTILVQVGDEPPFRITCAIDSKWSRCIPLPKGESFDAKREKRGIVVYYEDDKGKMRSQLYTYVAQDAKANTAQPAAAGQTQPGPAATKNAAQASPVPAPAGSGQQTVKCTFSSTPSGAEVTLDGRYVGSTPSILEVATGNHTVLISLPGFAPWKRELTVSPGSELTVNAVMEKLQ
jgi:hypothetical protein